MDIKMTIQEHIQENIKLTAQRLQDDGILTVEQMIPGMAAASYPKRHRLNLAYGQETEWEKLDIFYPSEGDGPFPVFIEVHGGGWYFGQKSSVEFQPFLHGLDRGFACVSVGYTLSPEAIYPQAVKEVRAAVAYLRQHAKELMLDTSQLVLWGGSAGAQLAAQAAFTGADPQILVLWFGYYDYFQNRKLEDWVYENHLGTTELSKAVEQLQDLNPINHIKRPAPYVMLQHGLKDTVVPYEQSVQFYEKMCSIAGRESCVLELVEDCDHADSRMFAPAHIKALFDKLTAYLKAEKAKQK